MHTLVITEHPEFGKVRTVEIGDRVWFCARDVASALGYANPKDAVNRHCKPKGDTHPRPPYGRRPAESEVHRRGKPVPPDGRQPPALGREVRELDLRRAGPAHAQGGRLPAGKGGGNGHGIAFTGSVSGRDPDQRT